MTRERDSMRFARTLLMFATALAAAPAMATPIIYAFYGRLSGTLGDTPFRLAPSIFTFRSDTDLVFQPRPDTRPTSYNTPSGTLYFSIDGIAGSFTAPYNVFSFSYPFTGLVGVTETGLNDLFDVSSASLIGYDLRSAVPPVDSRPIDFLNYNTVLDTTAGSLVLANDSFGIVRFTSRLGKTAPVSANAALAGAVPEPGGWTLALAGFAMIGAGLRRRQDGAARRLAVP